MRLGTFGIVAVLVCLHTGKDLAVAENGTVNRTETAPTTEFRVAEDVEQARSGRTFRIVFAGRSGRRGEPHRVPGLSPESKATRGGIREDANGHLSVSYLSIHTGGGIHYTFYNLKEGDVIPIGSCTALLRRIVPDAPDGHGGRIAFIEFELLDVTKIPKTIARK